MLGLQENVIASVKHFVAYEQETNRNPSSVNEILSTSANVDDQTMHEIYAWPFQDLVYAGAGCIMCSYNRINNTYACENSKTINGILKGEMNFQGFVVSDWTGQHSGIASANAGLDMAMPSSSYWDNDQLVQSIDNTTYNQTRLVDMATRIIATWYQFGQDDASYPVLGSGLPSDLLTSHKFVDARIPASRPSLLEQAVESHVLVKNVNSALPLQQPKVLSVFGYDAVDQVTYDPDTIGLFPQNWLFVNITEAIGEAIGEDAVVVNPPETASGVLTVGGGSGSNT